MIAFYSLNMVVKAELILKAAKSIYKRIYRLATSTIFQKLIDWKLKTQKFASKFGQQMINMYKFLFFRQNDIIGLLRDFNLLSNEFLLSFLCIESNPKYKRMSKLMPIYRFTIWPKQRTAAVDEIKKALNCSVFSGERC